MESNQNLGADLRRVIRKYGYNKVLDIELGTVLSVNPLSVAVDGVSTPIESDSLKVAYHLVNHSIPVTFAGTTDNLEFPMQLEEADRVALIYDVDRGFFFILDKSIDAEDI